MKIYVASSWRNPRQPALVKMLRAWGYEVYDFKKAESFHWRDIDPGYKHWTSGDLVRALGHDLANKAFNIDFEALSWADVGVLALPCGKSAHIEAGLLAGANKPVFVVLDQNPEPEIMYKACSGGLCVNLGELQRGLEVVRRKMERSQA